MDYPPTMPPIYPKEMSLEQIIELTISELIPAWKKIEKQDRKPLTLPALDTGIRLEGIFHGREININIYRLGLSFWLQDRERNAEAIGKLIIEKICNDLNILKYLAS